MISLTLVATPEECRAKKYVDIMTQGWTLGTHKRILEEIGGSTRIHADTPIPVTVGDVLSNS